jgi:hypothetical protein
MNLRLKARLPVLLGLLACAGALILLVLLFCQNDSENCALYYHSSNPIERAYRHTTFGLLISEERHYRDGHVEVEQGWLHTSLLNYGMVVVISMTLIVVILNAKRRLRQ